MGILKDASRFVVTLILITAAQAAALPADTVVQNVNGVQQCVKTYTVSPDFPSEKLAEASFERDGWLYTFSSISKKENYFEDEKPHTETATVQTSSQELSEVLSALPPTKSYDDGKYRGVLHLNASTIHTEAAGVETQSYAVSATREFADLDSNDMSYIPATMTKDGVTLSLQSVDWQIQESELVEDMLIPSSYKAVASYAGTGYRKAATGYVSAASYAGMVSCRVLKDVTYTVTYVGVPVEPPPKETEEPPGTTGQIEELPETVGEISESAERSNESDDAGETPEPPPVADAPDVPETPGDKEPETEWVDNGASTEIPQETEAAELPETRQPNEPEESEETGMTESDGGLRRFLYACGGVVALIVIALVAAAMNRRKQEASGYDDSPYYGGYAEPPYNPPYGTEDENAPYDNGPAPWETDAWEEDGVSYPADGARYGAEEIESEALNPESAEQPYNNSNAVPYGTDAPTFENNPPPEDDYLATDEESESGRGDVSDL